MNNQNWNTEINTSSELEKDLLVKEVMRLRRQCERLYDISKTARSGIWDLYETPKKDAEERLERLNTYATVMTTVIENIDKEQTF